MLTQTIASYTKKNDNIEEDSYNNKRKGQKRKNTAPPDQDNQGSKERKVPALVMWYLPVIDRLKCLFSNAREAQLLLWHVQWKRDGKIPHLADGRKWKHFDLSHKVDFSNDPRNIRFCRNTNGMCHIPKLSFRNVNHFSHKKLKISKRIHLF
jgi:hypothetical protein